MPTTESLAVLGDEHVGPILSVWSVAPAAIATRSSPQRCETLGDAMAWATVQLHSCNRPGGWPWVRRAAGRVLSPAYLRAYAKAPAA